MIAEWRLRDRREEIRAALVDVIGAEPHLVRAGSRGRDSIYRLLDGERCLGMLRVLNPYLRRKPLPGEYPFMVLEGSRRIEREWQSYQRGHHAGVTPVPLWRDTDALLCSWIPGTRLSQSLAAKPASFWSLLLRAHDALARLHAAGLVHMDASLANIVHDESRDRLVFIDFEYGPAARLTVTQQRLYDHLRLLESSLKFLPARCRSGYPVWLAHLAGHLDHETRHADPAPLQPALERVMRFAELRAGLREIVPRFP